jgi:hypothetical protein
MYSIRLPKLVTKNGSQQETKAHPPKKILMATNSWQAASLVGDLNFSSIHAKPSKG